MAALCAGRSLCCAARWWRPPPSARKLPAHLQHCIKYYSDAQAGPGAPRAALGLRRRRRGEPALGRVRSGSPAERPREPEPPSAPRDHPAQLRPPSSSQDHPARASSSSQDHPAQLRASSAPHIRDLQDPEPPSAPQEHPAQLRPPSSSQDHPAQLRAPPAPHIRDLQDPEPPSAPQDQPGQLRPPSSSQDHPAQLRASSTPQEIRDLQDPELPSAPQEHPAQLRPPLSSQDHPAQLRPPSAPHIRDLQDPEPPSAPHIRDLQVPEPSSAPQDQPGQLRSPSSSQDHPAQLRSPSAPQEIRDLQDPEPPSAPQNHPALQQQHAAPPDSAAPQGVPFQPGDLLLAEHKKSHQSTFRRMFILNSGGRLASSWGAVGNKELLGKLPGQKVRTSSGQQILLKRPSLDEYVLYMPRGPNISYPKDVAAMLMMMDVNPGDVILEAGSGSGALSLFLSRAVGPDGCIHSIEVRSDHHRIAKKNFLTWKKAWAIRSGRCWPDNVTFIHKDVQGAMSALRSAAFDAVALDMLNPQAVLPAIIGNLKPGSVCAVYLTNITQVIDLLEGIRSCELPLSCEKVLEVSVTDWLVAPSLRKDGRVSKRVEPLRNLSSEAQAEEQADDEDESETDGDPEIGSQPFGAVPYIARPMPWQAGHTAFLVQLRKITAAESPEPGVPSGPRGRHR